MLPHGVLWRQKNKMDSRLRGNDNDNEIGKPRIRDRYLQSPISVVGNDVSSFKIEAEKLFLQVG